MARTDFSYQFGLFAGLRCSSLTWFDKLTNYIQSIWDGVVQLVAVVVE